MFIKDKPYDWRDGQTIFNFLEWLNQQGYEANQSMRMADPFNIPDDVLKAQYKKFLLTLNK